MPRYFNSQGNTPVEEFRKALCDLSKTMITNIAKEAKNFTPSSQKHNNDYGIKQRKQFERSALLKDRSFVDNLISFCYAREGQEAVYSLLQESLGLPRNDPEMKDIIAIVDAFFHDVNRTAHPSQL